MQFRIPLLRSFQACSFRHRISSTLHHSSHICVRRSVYQACPVRCSSARKLRSLLLPFLLSMQAVHGTLFLLLRMALWSGMLRTTGCRSLHLEDPVHVSGLSYLLDICCRLPILWILQVPSRLRTVQMYSHFQGPACRHWSMRLVRFQVLLSFCQTFFLPLSLCCFFYVFHVFLCNYIILRIRLFRHWENLLKCVLYF